MPQERNDEQCNVIEDTSLKSAAEDRVRAAPRRILEDVIVGFYHRWARRKLPRDAIANRYILFNFYSPYPLTNVNCRVYSTSEQAYFDYFVRETFPRKKKIEGTIRLEQKAESAIFKSAKEVCNGTGCVVLCSRWSDRDLVKARCFIQDKSCDYSYRLVVNSLQASLEAQETMFAVRKSFDPFLNEERVSA